MKNSEKFIALFILLIVSQFVFAQTTDNKSCINNLSIANGLYEKAKFGEAVALLEPCVNSNKLGKYQADALRMLGLCYQQLGEETKTSLTVYKLLKYNPKYKLFPLNDPIEFTKVVNSFSVSPELFFDINAGFNYSIPVITKAYSVKPATLKPIGKPGQFLGVGATYFLKNPKIAVIGKVNLNSLSYSESVIFGANEKINYSEDLNFVNVVIGVKYFLTNKEKFRPFIGLGVNTLLLRSGLSNVVYTNSFLEAKTENSRNMKSGISNPLLLNGATELGFTTRAGKGILSVGLEYNYSFTNSINSSRRYNDIEFILTNLWVDSDVNIHYCNFSLSYSFPVLWRIIKNK